MDASRFATLRRSFVALFVTIGLTAAASGQSADYCGFRAFETGNAGNGVPQRLVCGDAFSCVPHNLTVQPGASISTIVMGAEGGWFALFAAYDPNTYCFDLGIPLLVHQLSVNLNGMITVAAGALTRFDGGRCNGAMEIFDPLFTVPIGIPSASLPFQAAATTPLTGGGIGVAFSTAIVVNF